MIDTNNMEHDDDILVSNEWYQIYTTQREDNIILATKLLRMQLDHSLKINELEKVLNCGDLIETFPLDLLDIVADLLCVPADNSSQYEQGSPELYCREWCWDAWFSYGNDVDREEHIKWFIKTMTEHVLEYRRVNGN